MAVPRSDVFRYGLFVSVMMQSLCSNGANILNIDTILSDLNATVCSGDCGRAALWKPNTWPRTQNQILFDDRLGPDRDHVARYSDSWEPPMLVGRQMSLFSKNPLYIEPCPIEGAGPLSTLQLNVLWHDLTEHSHRAPADAYWMAVDGERRERAWSVPTFEAGPMVKWRIQVVREFRRPTRINCFGAFVRGVSPCRLVLSAQTSKTAPYRRVFSTPVPDSQRFLVTAKTANGVRNGAGLAWVVSAAEDQCRHLAPNDFVSRLGISWEDRDFPPAYGWRCDAWFCNNGTLREASVSTTGAPERDFFVIWWFVALATCAIASIVIIWLSCIGFLDVWLWFGCLLSVCHGSFTYTVLKNKDAYK
ncbi:t22.2 [Tupaiid betaherpesvirus 1]|uniref:T22.2 n=1 Tax=Tupaiid herpesvirus 1 (strain 1) TaxID=10397 RepID=Q91TT7_TUHV1|nr:t22.2 [Tupaiid betaherpesvirus 1]AAK57050.1 t22.2 [Tupaiid betaherpesvirus 1]